MKIFRKLARFFNKFDYKYISSEKDGRSMAIGTNGRLYLIDENYEMLYDAGFEYLNHISGKVIWSNDKIILVGGFKLYVFNKDLQMVKKIPFELSKERSKASSFNVTKNGMYIIGLEQNGKYQKGVIDVDGNVKVPFEYDSLRYIKNDQFAAANHNKTDIFVTSKNFTKQIMNIEGEYLGYKTYKDKIYYEFVVHGEGNNGNMYGLYDQNFEKIIDFECDSFGSIDKNGDISFTKNGKVGLYNVETGKQKFW